ncbi:MAG: hypothetical protein U0573_08975 [Phycisphaerales bacterium]|nr:hypothetical protein [Planctomycetota bacterium]
MKKSTTIAIAIVCAVIAGTALVSTRFERSKWITPASGGAVGEVKPTAPTAVPAASTFARGTPEWDTARVKEILVAEKKSISDEDIDLCERVALAKVNSQNDPVMAPRWALALAGDMPFDPPPTPAQAKRLDDLVKACLDHGAWRMRQVAIGFCWSKKWLADPAIRQKVEQIAKSDPATQAKLAAERALEQFDKTEAYRKNVGPP